MRAQYKITVLLLAIVVMFGVTLGLDTYFTAHTDGNANAASRASVAASNNSSTASGAALAASKQSAKAAKAAEAAAKAASAENRTLKQAVAKLTLLLNTDHATTVRRDSQLAVLLEKAAATEVDVKALLTNGHSQAAQNAKQSKEAAEAGDALIAKVFAQFQAEHALLCLAVEDLGAASPAKLVQLQCVPG